MKRELAAWIAISGLGLMLSGCAAVRSAQETVGGWFGSADEPAAGKPQARYSAAAGVALYRNPDDSSEVVGKLALYEGVLRYRVEGGYAYVTSEKSGRSGWVRDRQLIERLPATKKPAAATPAPSPSAEEPSAQEEPPAESEPPATEEPPAPPREKSIFDPY